MTGTRRAPHVQLTVNSIKMTFTPFLGSISIMQLNNVYSNLLLIIRAEKIISCTEYHGIPIENYQKITKIMVTTMFGMVPYH